MRYTIVETINIGPVFSFLCYAWRIFSKTYEILYAVHDAIIQAKTNKYFLLSFLFFWNSYKGLWIWWGMKVLSPRDIFHSKSYSKTIHFLSQMRNSREKCFWLGKWLEKKHLSTAFLTDVFRYSCQETTKYICLIRSSFTIV